MDSFLRHTAKEIIKRLNWQQLSRTTLVLPSHRAGLVLKNELLQLQRDQNQKAIWAPDVKTLQQLQDALSPLYTEDELMTIVRLYRIYRNNQDESTVVARSVLYLGTTDDCRFHERRCVDACLGGR